MFLSEHCVRFRTSNFLFQEFEEKNDEYYLAFAISFNGVPYILVWADDIMRFKKVKL